MELHEKSYRILYANWFEYNEFRKNYPFVTEFFTTRFKEWPRRNKLVIDQMLKKRKDLIEEYVKVDTSISQYMQEEHEGKWRYVLIDEEKRAQFEILFEQWEDKTVQVYC